VAAHPAVIGDGSRRRSTRQPADARDIARKLNGRFLRQATPATTSITKKASQRAGLFGFWSGVASETNLAATHDDSGQFEGLRGSARLRRQWPTNGR
jgi:hypothetical protein